MSKYTNEEMLEIAKALGDAFKCSAPGCSGCHMDANEILDGDEDFPENEIRAVKAAAAAIDARRRDRDA